MSDINFEEQFHKSALDSAKRKKDAQNPVKIARDIIDEQVMIYYGDSFFRYEVGRYTILNENQMKQLIHQHLKYDYRQAKFKEISDCMMAQCLVNDLNPNHGVNILNGILNLETMELKPHSKDQHFTTQLKAIYDPEAKSPKWDAFLNEMLMDDPAKILVLQEYSGYALDYGVNVEMIIFLLGRGANGKSVFCDAIKTVIGYGNYASISLDDLKNKNYVAELLGKLVNISTESQAKAEIYESNLKKLASGEEITVDRKFKNPFSFKSNCKHIYCLNNLPRVGDRTDAFFRRILPIPFNMQVERHKRILRLGQLIGEEEPSGILNWMLDGYKRLRSNSWQFTQSQQVNELLDEYRKDNNNVLNFVDECCHFGTERSQDYHFMSNEDSYIRYQRWCKESGCNSFKKKNFVDEIIHNFKHQKVIRDKVNGKRGLLRISLLPEEPSFSPESSGRYS